MGLWKRLLSALGILLAVGSVLEYLALPALFVVIGVLNDFGWQYYAWTIGGYIVVVALAELVGAAIGTLLGKAFEPRLARKLKARQNSPTEEI